MRGLEPPTPGITIRCSNQLSYTHRKLANPRLISEDRRQSAAQAPKRHRQTGPYLARTSKLTSVARRFFLLTAVSGSLAVTCRPLRPTTLDITDRAQAQQQLDRFRDLWLYPAHIPDPPVDLSNRTHREGLFEVTVHPIRPEAAFWNQYAGSELRLFNNRAGWFFEVAATGNGSVRWVPTGSKLEINTATDVRFPFVSPETLLEPLIEHARLQEEWMLDGDLHLRAGRAREFRASYLSAAERTSIHGVVGFGRLMDPGPIHSMRLTMAFQDDDGLHRVQWVFE